MAVLKMKSTGKDVEKYQAALNKAGISRKLKVDGIFGRKTEASTKGFQKKKSLKPDGIAGKKTLAAAGIGRQPPPPKMTFDDAKEFKLVYESSANYMLGESQNIENLTKTEIAKLKVAEKLCWQ